MSTSPDMAPPLEAPSAEVLRLPEHDTDPDQLKAIKTMITGVADAGGAKALAGAAVASSQGTAERVRVLEHEQRTLDVKLERWEAALRELSAKVGALTESGKLERAMRVCAYFAVIVMGSLLSVWAGLQLLDRYHGGGG